VVIQEAMRSEELSSEDSTKPSWSVDSSTASAEMILTEILGGENMPPEMAASKFQGSFSNNELWLQ
jgi:hypothetical protein